MVGDLSFLLCTNLHKVVDERGIMHIPSRAMEHLSTLCENGPRPIGSTANKKAVNYIKDIFGACGLVISEQKFACIDWCCSSTILRADTLLHAEANAFSYPCNVTGELLPVQTIKELESATLTDKIALLYGDLTKNRWIPKNCKVMSSERDQKIVALLEEKNPLAIITVTPHKGGMRPVIEDRDFLIPSATVSPETGLQLMHTPGRVTLTIESCRHKSVGSNVCGTNSDAKGRIVLCAHVDTKIGTPGAFDNSAGVAVLLTLAELFAEKEGIEFVVFNDEEYNGVGDYEYINNNEFESIKTVINIDGVGHVLGTHSVTMMEHSAAFHTAVSEIKPAYPGIVWVDPWPQSNHSTFSSRGVPCIAVSSVGVGIAHSSFDTVGGIGADKLSEVVLFVADIVDAVHNNNVSWF